MIRILDEKTINKIAAGEVVERPASAIKELVENAIDAGATSIEVEISEGGSSYMRVSDNGCGMTEEDARLAVLRHATSKIERVEDLFDIASLGFRGEALASISAVSKFILTTRQEKQELGTKLTMEGGQLIDCMPGGTNIGTTIEVRELFFNTPARKKFLKTDRTENGKIQDIIGKLAISNLHIAFKLIVDNRVTMVTPGNDKVMDCLAALYGYEVTESLFPIAYEAEGIVIEGAVSKPSLLKGSRIWQTVIVNNRVISDKTISKAIDNAYHALLPKNGYPLVVLNIVVPSESIDINVHPRKSEVKFSDDKVVFRAVYHAILQGLTNIEKKTLDIATTITQDKSPIQTAKINWDDLPYTQSTKREETNNFISHIKQDGYEAPPRSNFVQETFPHASGIDFPKSYNQEDKETFKEIYGQIQTRKHQDIYFEPSMGNLDKMIPLGQVASCYILAKKGEDLYIIDQHAAHERVRYDKLCASSEDIPSQELLIPRYFQASEHEIFLVEENQQVFFNLGFQVEQGGPNQIKISASPIDLNEESAEDVFKHILVLLEENHEPNKAQLRHRMLAYASCRGAIKAGHNLNTYQMNVLLDDLFHTEKPYVCPHGRPTIVRFTPAELGKLFKRS